MFYGAIKTISHNYQIDGSRKADEKFRRNVFKIFLSVFTDTCLNRVPLSSTLPQFNTKGPLLFNPQNHSVSHQNPSVPQQRPLSSTSKTPQFHIPLSYTPKTPQFHTSLCSRPETPQFNTLLSSTPKTPHFNRKN